MRLTLKSAVVLLSLTALCACAVGKHYDSPTPQLDIKWHSGLPVSSACKDVCTASESWWKAFHDPVLNQLIDYALVNNNDLKTAEARIREARANKKGNFSAFFPKIDAVASLMRGKTGASSGERLDTTRQAGISGSWDIDVFGGNRRRFEAAEANAQAEEARRDQIRLDVITEVARNYVRLRSLQQQRALTIRNLKTQQDTLKITKGQRQEGAVSDLEVARAGAQTGATSARLPQIKSAEFAAITRLTTLTATGFDTLSPLLSKEKPIPVIDRQYITALPIQVMKKRPDIRAAERDLAANTALSGAALANFFPRLTLEGFYGAEHSSLFGNASPWSASANALMPLLHFGELSAQLESADARQQQAFFTYKQAVLIGVEETENAYSAYKNESGRLEILRNVATNQSQAANIAREQYRSGVITQLDLLVAESNQLAAESELVLSEQAVAENIILLHRALGDDGKVTEPTPPAPTPVVKEEGTFQKYSKTLSWKPDMEKTKAKAAALKTQLGKAVAKPYHLSADYFKKLYN